MARTQSELSDSTHVFDSSSLNSVIRNHKYILTLARSRRRNVDLSFILNAGVPFYYYAATEQDNTLAEYAAHLSDAFQSADPEFGKQSGRGRSGSANDLAQKLAREINASGRRFVVLDEVDYLNDLGAEVFEFIFAFGQALSANTSLVVSARQIDYRQWRPLLDNGQAVLLDHAAESGIGDCCPQVEVYGFGGGLVLSDGLPVTVWDGPLPRNLFYYFIDHPTITRTDIFSTFWHDLPTKEATNVFHVTKRKVTERVGHETMSYSGGFYHLAKDVNLYYDVAEFEAAIDAGRRNPDDSSHWLKAIQLYRHPFLYGLRMPWMVERRQKLAQDYTEALVEMARSLRRRDAAQSISYFLRALREVPHREDIHRDVMKLYAEQGHMDWVTAQYRGLESELKRAFNIVPGKATRELYASLTSKSRDR